MGITSKHPEYKRWAPKWLRCRHFVEGEDAVKAQGLVYLPPLDPKEMMKPDEQARYQAYKDRATFFGASGRTVEGLVGAVHRKEPTFTVPDLMKDRIEDITGTGISATEFSKLLVAELLTTGRLGILVDKRPGEDTTLATAAMYNAENITNWIDGGKTAVVLQEMSLKAKDGDRYELQEVTTFRELMLDEKSAYIQNIHEPKAGTSGATASYEITSTAVPTNRGKRIGDIPFVFVSPRGVTESFETPPILGLVNVNRAHYRLSADYDHGLHWTALPTPWFAGLRDDKEAIALGPQGGICLPADGKAGMLEFTGAGLLYVENGLKSKEAMMGALGAQLLTPPKGVEAADTAKIHQSGQIVTLHTVAQAVEEAMEKILTLIGEWDGITGEIDVEINKEFIEVSIDAKLLTALVTAWQAGGMDLDTLLFNIKKYGLTNPDDSIDDIKGRIDEESAKAQSDAERAFKLQQGAPGQDPTQPTKPAIDTGKLPVKPEGQAGE